MSEPSEDFEKAWAAIVAELSADLPDDPDESARNDDGSPDPDSSTAGTAAPGADPDGVDSDLPGTSGPHRELGALPSGAQPADLEPPDRQPSAESPPPGRTGPAPVDPALFTRWDRSAPTPAPQERPNRAGDFVDNWEDEGHYDPPPPPELPSGTPRTRLAWAGALGGPATLLLSVLTPWDPPSVVTWGAALATLAGFVTLVWSLPESREDGWDDGARL